MTPAALVSKIYPLFLSEQRRKQFEQVVFLAAIVLFVLHFLLIVGSGAHGRNPLAAIYTPFSLILLYEVYLLIFYLPRSISVYLGKQYEVVALIMIRKLFDDLATLAGSGDTFTPDALHGLLLTFAGLLVLFLLIFLFYRLSGNHPERIGPSQCTDARIRRFYLVKEIMAIGLVVFFAVLFFRSFFELRDFASLTIDNVVAAIAHTNALFFDTFFTALILTEVLLLLFTFELSDSFSKVIRNSGFIISTILLKLSFRAEGLMNIALILVAVAFGVAILGIYKLYGKKSNSVIE